MTTKQLGTAIRAARGKRTRNEISKLCGLAHHQIKAIEEARTNYTINSLLALCNAVGVKLKH